MALKVKTLLLLILCSWYFPINTKAKVLFPGKEIALLSDSPNTADPGFSEYNTRTKMLYFTKYVEKPIPLKVWIDTSAFFLFSDTLFKDCFRFSVIGDYEYTATAYFQIISKTGSCIFKDSFPLMNLLSIYLDGGGYYGTKTQKENAIKEYAENLLNEYNIEGALNQLPERLEPEFTHHQNHEQLSNDCAEKFFSYSRKMDSNTYIGYDPLLGMALKFYETYD
jgi:hypothetical protein